MGIEEWVKKLNIIDPRKVKIVGVHLDTFDAEINGKFYCNIKPKKPFPYTRPEYLILYTQNGEEVGILRDYRRLDGKSRESLERVLNIIYFIPRVKRILGLKAEGWIYEWVIETDKGIVKFKSYSRCTRQIGPFKVLLKDVNTNVYLIEDLRRLDSKSLSLLRIVL